MSCEVFSFTTWLLESPEKPSIAIATAVQFKTFYRTCSAMRVLLMAGLVGLSTSDRILTSYVEFRNMRSLWPGGPVCLYNRADLPHIFSAAFSSVQGGKISL